MVENSVLRRQHILEQCGEMLDEILIQASGAKTCFCQNQKLIFFLVLLGFFSFFLFFIVYDLKNEKEKNNMHIGIVHNSVFINTKLLSKSPQIIE